MTYNLDKAGNRSGSNGVVDTGVPTSYTPNNLNEYTGVGGTNNVTNDNEHEIAAYQGVSYTYINDTHLVGVSGGNPYTNYALAYDALGRCVKRTLNGATTYYIYDGEKPIQEIGPAWASTIYGIGIDEPVMLGAGHELEAGLRPERRSFVGPQRWKCRRVAQRPKVSTSPRKRLSPTHAIGLTPMKGVKCGGRAAGPRCRPPDRCAVRGGRLKRRVALKPLARQPRSRSRRRCPTSDRVRQLRGWVERGWSGDASNGASEFWRKNIQDGRSVHLAHTRKGGKSANPRPSQLLSNLRN